MCKDRKLAAMMICWGEFSWVKVFYSAVVWTWYRSWKGIGLFWRYCSANLRKMTSAFPLRIVCSSFRQIYFFCFLRWLNWTWPCQSNPNPDYTADRWCPWWFCWTRRVLCLFRQSWRREKFQCFWRLRIMAWWDGSSWGGIPWNVGQRRIKLMG